VQEITKSFVCVADDVNTQQTGRAPKAAFFLALARQGHAKGVSGVTQQGTYCFTPSGTLLGSDNSRDPERIGRLIQASLARWNELPKEQRLRAESPALPAPVAGRGEAAYPADGLVLRLYSRDLGPSKRSLGDYATPWNTDMVWFSRAAAAQPAPAYPRPGRP